MAMTGKYRTYRAAQARAENASREREGIAGRAGTHYEILWDKETDTFGWRLLTDEDFDPWTAQRITPEGGLT